MSIDSTWMSAVTLLMPVFAFVCLIAGRFLAELTIDSMDFSGVVVFSILAIAAMLAFIACACATSVTFTLPFEVSFFGHSRLWWLVTLPAEVMVIVLAIAGRIDYVRNHDTI